VWFYSDRMEIKSPGELVPPVTVEKLLERKPLHASRNPLLVRVLVEAGVMREEGEGIPRMFEEMEESFLYGPGFVVEDGEFVVTLLRRRMVEERCTELFRISTSNALSSR